MAPNREALDDQTIRAKIRAEIWLGLRDYIREISVIFGRPGDEFLFLYADLAGAQFEQISAGGTTFFVLPPHVSVAMEQADAAIREDLAAMATKRRRRRAVAIAIAERWKDRRRRYEEAVQAVQELRKPLSDAAWRQRFASELENRGFERTDADDLAAAERVDVREILLAQVGRAHKLRATRVRQLVEISQPILDARDKVKDFHRELLNWLHHVAPALVDPMEAHLAVLDKLMMLLPNPSPSVIFELSPILWKLRLTGPPDDIYLGEIGPDSLSVKRLR